MSTNYYACQFNDAYLPHRLGNWEKPAPIEYYCRRPSRTLSQYRTNFITDDRGRLLSPVKQKLFQSQSSPHQARIDPHYSRLSHLWLGECGCAQKRRERKSLQQDTEEASKEPLQPAFLNQKRTKKSSLKRDQQERTGGRPAGVPEDPLLLYLKALSLPVIWIVGNPTQEIRRRRKEISLRLAAELDFALIDLEDEVEKWIKRESLGNEVKVQPLPVPSYRSLKKRGGQSSEAQQSVLPPEPGLFRIPSVSFNTATPLPTSTILDLLKIAMTEALPTSGFLLAGFPCNLEEASGFERLLYPSALALYFLPRDSKSLLSPPLSPLNFRRKIGFTFDHGNKLCLRRNFGRKVIRVLDTENVDEDTLAFLLHVVRENLTLFRQRGDVALRDFATNEESDLDPEPVQERRREDFSTEEDEEREEEGRKASSSSENETISASSSPAISAPASSLLLAEGEKEEVAEAEVDDVAAEVMLEILSAVSELEEVGQELVDQIEARVAGMTFPTAPTSTDTDSELTVTSDLGLQEAERKATEVKELQEREDDLNNNNTLLEEKKEGEGN